MIKSASKAEPTRAEQTREGSKISPLPWKAVPQGVSNYCKIESADKFVVGTGFDALDAKRAAISVNAVQDLDPEQLARLAELSPLNRLAGLLGIVKAKIMLLPVEQQRGEHDPDD